jgi:putative PIN family toxin of toxin-antitoxin system
VRVFLDTNVLVSAFATRGLCVELFELVLQEHDLVVGRRVLDELGRALRRKLRMPERTATEIVDFVAGEAVEIVERAQAAEAPVDRDDALVLGEALAGRSDVFVTGDRAVGSIGRIADLPVVTPKAFWEMLRTRRR